MGGRGNHWALATARLKPDVHWRTAETEIRGIAARSQKEYPGTNARTQVWIAPFLLEMIGGMSGQILILLFTSYKSVHSIPFAFDTENVLTARILLAGERYDDHEKKTLFWGRLTEQLERLVGVERAAVTTKLPLEGGNNSTILVEGESYDPEIGRRLVESS